MRKSANISRIRKGDKFVDPVRGDQVIANGFAQRFPDGTVKVPVIADGATRSSRRRFSTGIRVKILV